MTEDNEIRAKLDGAAPSRIVDVRVEVFGLPPVPGKWSVMIGGQAINQYIAESVAISVRSEQGIVGESITVAGGLGLGHYIAGLIRPFLIGRDVRMLEQIWQDMWLRNRLWRLPQFAIGCVDVALWDLWAKTLDVPLYQLLGGYRSRLPAYASSPTRDTVEEYVAEALEYQRRGLAGYKIHPRGEVEFDIETCTAVREAVGPDWPLMLDPAGGYNQRQALRVGRALDALDYYWFEEPIHDWDAHGLRWLADQLTTPLCGVESNEGGMYSTPEFITTRAVDIVRSDVCFKGGVGAVKKTAGLCEAFGLNLELHANVNPLLNAANLAIALSVKNTDFYELLVPETLFDFPTTGDVLIDGDGCAVAPEGPGLGVSIDWDALAETSVARL
ncbi:enolase C-terminal domain-like protein [Pseudonocardia oroxyli]|uniref:L-alanine-DL-glutamate epimerase n=1 Tax=Pseudonocardia oroxyli TaxID=366584 RepID=A0A1G7STG8_PSEOR|nr:enolase C-terminal domain-like protein [Pseudonocardia oroxyli]SDG26248.1 L-alanine-DL-glutamate epimerase [Pseudonocardia oroxyli]